MLSVIIPTCNRNDLLNECLKRLEPHIQSATLNEYEVIVSDDSKENSGKKLISNKYPSVQWVKGLRKGPAANRNNGAEYAKGEWLIFIDDDCEPDSRFISSYVDGINKNPAIKVFEGAINADRERRRFDEEAPVNLEGGYLFSCNFGIEKNYFKYLNGFDENFPFPAMEDTELAYRIKQDNQLIFFLKDALVVHPWRMKKNVFNMTLKRFDAALYFIKKHPSEKARLGSHYYLMAFIHSFYGIFRYGLKFRFRGVHKKILHDVMLLYFAAYMLFRNK